MSSDSATATHLSTTLFADDSPIDAARLLAHSAWRCVQEFAGKSKFADEAIRLKETHELDIDPRADLRDTEARLLLLRLQEIFLISAIAQGDEEIPPEPPRDSWRLQLLREWSHEQVEQVFP